MLAPPHRIYGYCAPPTPPGWWPTTSNARKAESVGRMSEASSAFGSASPRTALPKTDTEGHCNIDPLSSMPPTDGRLQSLTSLSGHFLQLSHDSTGRVTRLTFMTQPFHPQPHPPGARRW